MPWGLFSLQCLIFPPDVILTTSRAYSQPALQDHFDCQPKQYFESWAGSLRSAGIRALTIAEVFHVLGSQIDLSGLAMPPSSLRFTVGNKPGRAEFICSLLHSLCKADAATRRDLSVIRGHLNFASGLYYIMVKCCEPLAICCPRHCSRAGGGSMELSEALLMRRSNCWFHASLPALFRVQPARGPF